MARRRSTRRSAGAVAVALLAVLPAACGLPSTGGQGGVVELEFFQFKSEAIADFQALVDKFNAENPGIRVVQNDSPDAETAIRVRLVKNDVPDVMALNVNGPFAELAQADVFRDFSSDPVLTNVSDGSLKVMTDLGTAVEGQVPGVPYTMSAGGIIYNKDLFAEHDIEPPTTWEEFVAACEKLKAAGVTPIQGTLKEAWTALPSFNGLVGPSVGPDFWEKRAAKQTSFSQAWAEPMARQAQLYSYAQKNLFSTDYDMGNQAFAKGEAAMLPQGSWAIPVIRGFEPGFEIGVFPYPVAKNADEQVLTSGVDVTLTMVKDAPHPQESMKFIEFLMREDNVEAFTKAQSAVPTLEGIEPSEKALVDLMPYYENDRLIGFIDLHIPPSVGLEPYLHQARIDGDTEGFLTTLDQEWDKVAERRSPRRQ